MTLPKTPPCLDCGKVRAWHGSKAIVGATKRCYRCAMALRQDIDETVVERLAAGYPCPAATWGELRAAADQLDNGRRSASQIAARIGVTVRTVQRYRQARRQVAA